MAVTPGLDRIKSQVPASKIIVVSKKKNQGLYAQGPFPAKTARGMTDPKFPGQA